MNTEFHPEPCTGTGRCADPSVVSPGCPSDSGCLLKKETNIGLSNSHKRKKDEKKEARKETNLGLSHALKKKKRKT